MSYENAPATRMLASHCVACGRPLVDAVSVEAGMGPDCREKYGYYAAAATEAARDDVNARVAKLARGGVAPAEQVADLLIIAAHGFTVLAAKLEERLVSCVVEQVSAECIALTTPYDERFIALLKAATPWRKFDRETKRWVVPASANVKNALFAAMRRCYGGTLGRGPAGLFAVEVMS